MKITMRLLSLTVLISALLCCSNAMALPRLAVRAFDDKTEAGDAPAAAITDMMVTELDKAKIFLLVEREKLSYIAEEVRLSQSGLVDPSTAVEMGKLTGAQYSMTGAITLYYYNEKAKGGIKLPQIGSLFGVAQAKTAYVDIDIRVIDNTTGNIVYAEVKRGVADQASREPGLFNSSYNRTYGGILSAATRDAVTQHVGAMKKFPWQE